MKYLFENWRKYLNERIDGGPPKREPLDFDLGTTFTKISIDDITTGGFRNLTSMEQATVLAFLDQLAYIAEETDPEKIGSILRSIKTMSGNSPDFTFENKEEALRAYKTPFRYKAHPKDSKPTKSLKDWHHHLNIVKSIDRPLRRKEAIKDFYSSSDHYRGKRHSNTAEKEPMATKRERPA